MINLSGRCSHVALSSATCLHPHVFTADVSASVSSTPASRLFFRQSVRTVTRLLQLNTSFVESEKFELKPGLRFLDTAHFNESSALQNWGYVFKEQKLKSLSNSWVLNKHVVGSIGEIYDLAFLDRN